MSHPLRWDWHLSVLDWGFTMSNHRPLFLAAKPAPGTVSRRRRFWGSQWSQAGWMLPREGQDDFNNIASEISGESFHDLSSFSQRLRALNDLGTARRKQRRKENHDSDPRIIELQQKRFWAEGVERANYHYQICRLRRQLAREAKGRRAWVLISEKRGPLQQRLKPATKHMKTYINHEGVEQEQEKWKDALAADFQDLFDCTSAEKEDSRFLMQCLLSAARNALSKGGVCARC